MRATVLVAVLFCMGCTHAATTTAAPARNCYPVSVFPSSSSICRSGPGALCSTSQATADAEATAMSALLNAITTSFMSVLGQSSCAQIQPQASPDLNYWFSPRWCPPLSCDFTCGGTPLPQLPVCCNYYFDEIMRACFSVPFNVASNLATPQGSANLSSLPFYVGACSTGPNCRYPPVFASGSDSPNSLRSAIFVMIVASTAAVIMTF